MSKKVYFFTVSLKQNGMTQTRNDLLVQSYGELKATKAIDAGDYLTIFDGAIHDHVALDIFKDDYGIIMGRLGKGKDPNNAIMRDFQSGATDTVVSAEDAGTKSLEICTHFIFDLNTGIIGYISGQSAPSIQALESIWALNENFELKIAHLVNPDAVSLLRRPGSKLGSIQMTLARPHDAAMIELGFSNQQVQALAGVDFMEFNLVIKNGPHKKLTTLGTRIENILDTFSTFTPDIKNSIIFRGNAEGSSTRNFKYGQGDLVFSLKIDTTRVENGIRVILSPTDFALEACNKVYDLYNRQRRPILALANGLDEE